MQPQGVPWSAKKSFETDLVVRLLALEERVFAHQIYFVFIHNPLLD